MMDTIMIYIQGILALCVLLSPIAFIIMANIINETKVDHGTDRSDHDT
jgi:hypothetical protein